MPTPEELERLRAIAEAEPPTVREAEPFEDDEPKTLERASQVGPHVSVHVHQHEGKEKEKAHPLHKLAESGWVKAVLVVVLGAGGSEGHRLVAPTGLVLKSDLEKHKEELVRELGKEDARLEVLRSELARAEAKAALLERDHRELTVYLYGVLPKLGVQVTLPEGTEPPPRMEFHPPPLSLTIGPNAAKPIQPAQVFPLPLRSP